MYKTHHNRVWNVYKKHLYKNLRFFKLASKACHVIDFYCKFRSGRFLNRLLFSEEEMVLTPGARTKLNGCCGSL